jgi:hypothetical protein
VTALAGEHEALVAEEQLEQLELEAGQRDRAIAAAHLACPGVEREIPWRSTPESAHLRASRAACHLGGVVIVSVAFVAATRSAPPSGSIRADHVTIALERVPVNRAKFSHALRGRRGHSVAPFRARPGPSVPSQP